MNKINNYPILHGLEIELQLMAEVEGKLMIVSAKEFLWNKNKKTIDRLPKNIYFDMGNIEISTPPCTSYKSAIESANYSLNNKLIPYLIKDIELKKFALFLPNPISNLVIDNLPFVKNGTIHYQQTVIKTQVSCLKHWNISFPNIDILDNTYKWEYNLMKLFKKGYYIDYKDNCRIHIKIPYHYSPPEGNPDLMPKFEDTLIPPDNWRNLLCYYKNNNFVKVRNLI